MPDVRELNDRNNFNTDPAVGTGALVRRLRLGRVACRFLGRVVQLARDAPTLLILQE